jgi:hypothetical protein
MDNYSRPCAMSLRFSRAAGRLAAHRETQSTRAVRASSDNASPDPFHSRSKVKAHRHNSLACLCRSTPKQFEHKSVGHVHIDYGSSSFEK